MKTLSPQDQSILAICLLGFVAMLLLSALLITGIIGNNIPKQPKPQRIITYRNYIENNTLKNK